MGIDYNIYVGPYIGCTPTEGEYTVTYKGCPKCNKGTYAAATRFCPKCGTAITDMQKTQRGKLVTSQKVFGAFMEAGIDQDSIYAIGDGDDFRYVPNQDDMPGTHVDPRSEFGEVVAEEDFDIAADKAMLEKKLAPQIAVLRELFGAENVEVRWGVLSYTS